MNRFWEAFRGRLNREDHFRDLIAAPQAGLPLAASWNTGENHLDGNGDAGFHPKFQIELLEAGHFILPWFELWPYWRPGSYWKQTGKYYWHAMRYCARHGLPISLVSRQWEDGLIKKPFFDRPPRRNPNLVRPDGKIVQQVSPFGPLDAWRELGRKWVSTEIVRALQAMYPNPPLIVWVSNNESPKPRWKEIYQVSQRYRDRYEPVAGAPRLPGDCRRKAVAEGWRERYKALTDSMRQSLALETWRKNSKFIVYKGGYVHDLGRWPKWIQQSFATDEYFTFEPLALDGVSVHGYIDDWSENEDFRVWSPQVSAQNWVFMQQEAERLHPGFWFEISTWDGGVKQRKKLARRGEKYSPKRYQGMVQFMMWLIRPACVREFRKSTQTRTEYLDYLMAVVEAVDRVHLSPVLQRFWLDGRLVANPHGGHPYQTGSLKRLAKKYRDAPRWFLLDAGANPPRKSWSSDHLTVLSVFALALVAGEAPHRQWLLYAHAPQGPRRGTEITIPGYKPVRINVDVAGSFYVIDESSGRVTPVDLALRGARASHVS